MADAFDFNTLFYDDYYGVRWKVTGHNRIITWGLTDDFLILPSNETVIATDAITQYRPIVEEAFRLWDDALTSLNFSYVGIGNSANITLAITDIDGFGGVYGYWNSNWDSQKFITKSTIRIDGEDLNSNWMLTTLLHEIGNVLGLGDIRQMESLQSVQEDPFPLRFSGNALWRDDLLMIRQLYGSTESTDSIPPTISIASSVTSVRSGQTATITFTLSEAVTDFTISDVVTEGGSVSNFAGAGNIYSAIFTPTQNGVTSAVISIASGRFSDTAGNFNVDGADANNRISLLIEIDPASGDIDNGMIYGDDKPNILTGTTKNETFIGKSGIDRFNITAGVDSVLDLGKGGADILNVSAGATVNATGVAIWTASSATTNYGTANITTNGFAVNLSAVTAGNGFSVTNALAKKVVLTGSALSDSLVGNIGKDQLIGNAGADTLVGGQGADKLLGGAGSDTFRFAAGDTGQAKNFDLISDYTKGQVGIGDAIDYSANLSIGGTDTVATSTQASINSTTGVASFFSKSGSSTADALADISTSFTAAGDMPGEFAFFQVKAKGDYYLFISDGVAGISISDVVVRLVGVTSIGSIELTDGNLMIVA